MMRKRFFYLLLSLAAALSAEYSFGQGSSMAVYDSDFKQTLGVLDDVLSHREDYISSREQRILSLKTLLEKSSFSDEQTYLLNQEIINEYIPYQFDSTMVYLIKNIALATKMNDSVRLTQSYIQLGYRYAMGGVYLESSKILNDYLVRDQIQTEQLLPYFIAQHKLNDELSLYSLDSRQREISSKLTEAYCDSIISIAQPDSPVSLEFRTWKAMKENHYSEAERLTRQQLSSLSKSSHEFAKTAYTYSLIEEQKGRPELASKWSAHSAIADIQLAIRDHASLQRLAQDLLRDGDIERSMRYMRVVTEDAKFFNSRLRPWQDAQVLPDIEAAYEEHKSRMDHLQLFFICFMAIFLVASIVVVFSIMRQNKRIRIVRDNLKTTNDKLRDLNNAINEANAVKEEYIGIFLTMCSEYIDKIALGRRNVRRMLRMGRLDELKREYESIEQDDVDVKDFYTLFDTTFLKLYPTFITEFNALLAQGSQVEVKKGELLNTELRIYALIRLGISDSPKIAALLRYSLSTIYNYRSKYRNLYIGNPEEFEDKVKTVCSFSDTHVG